MGRPRKLTPHQRREAIARRDAGEALTDIAGTYGVSHTTIGRLTAAAPSAWRRTRQRKVLSISMKGSFRRPVIVIGQVALKFARNKDGRACKQIRG
jgi:Helix-turn-helix domain of resolvase